MKINLNKKNLIFLSVCLAVIVLGVVADQLTKGLFERLFDEGKLPIVVLPNVIDFTFVLNDGAAWGSLSGSSVLFFVLTLIALPIFCCLILNRMNNGVFSALGFAIVVSGTIGNAIDRAFYGDGFFNGAVRDFLATKFLGRLDFVCNVADILLTVGVVIVLIGMLFVDSDAIFKKHTLREEIDGKNTHTDFLYEIKDADNINDENKNEENTETDDKTEIILDTGETDDNG